MYRFEEEGGRNKKMKKSRVRRMSIRQREESNYTNKGKILEVMYIYNF